MKYLVILADGLSDLPIESLSGKTPVMAANTPNIDRLCSMSRLGLLHTVPDSLHPGSEVANMTVMGYDPEKYFTGRGVIEAVAMGVELADTDMAFRCNLVTVENDILKNHSAGHISSEEALELIKYLNSQLGDDNVQFYPGVSYRHLLVIKNGKGKIKAMPPHDYPGSPVKGLLPKSEDDLSLKTVDLVNQLIARSREILNDHPINIKRKEAGKSPANSIWPWSPGYKPQMPTLKEMYGLNSGSVISAVDLIHGIGRLAGLNSIHVEGATGLYTTNYIGKAQAAINALKTTDYVYLHIEAPDEAGHEGDIALKIRTIEDIDAKVVKLILNEIEAGEEITVAFLPDHPTPCELRTHTRDAVPFMIYRPNIKGDSIFEYNEKSAALGSFGTIKGTEFMKLLLNSK